MRLNRKGLRRLSQVSVALLFIAIPWINGLDIRFITGNLLSLDVFGIPFADPVAATQVGVSTWHLSGTMFIGAFLVLVLAAAMGPVFCSWICPYGLITDLVQKISLRRNGSGKNGLGFPYGLSIKITVVAVALLSVAALQLPPFLNQLSLPGWYTRTMQSLWLSGTIPFGFWLLPVASFIDFAGGGRIWCRYVCPQSLLLVLAGMVLPKRFRVVHDKSKCICTSAGLSPCTKSCPLGIDPRERDIHPECTNCGDCVVTCERFGQALSQKIARRKG